MNEHPVEDGGDAAPAPDQVRPGELSALIDQLVHGPEDERGAGWNRALRPGAVVGRFELVREIGRGGFGVVYEARDRTLGRLVAFKAVRAGPDAEARGDRLLREAEAAARLSHPNIVTLHDVGGSPQGPYLVMELLRGWTLSQRIEQGPLPVREAIRVGVEVAKGLAHAHAQGVIHRDLKPGNIFLCDDGQVKVLDLGMAHAFGHRKLDGGTPAYMAPEQWRGAPEDERTDVFAMGAVLFEMLAGEPPFTGSRDEVERASAAAPQLAVPEEPALGELIRRTLESDPVRRPRDAAEVLAALCAFQHELDRAPRRGDTSVARPRPVLHGRPPRRPTEHPRPDRTWLCSVVSVDMAGYADQSVDVQAGWRARFNALLAESIDEVPESDRVILATGEGAAVCFLGGPEAAIACALELVGPAARDDADPDVLRLRVGVHLGPVRLVRDLNGNLNALGDGVSVAQRVMGFAGENQIVVSRSFYEVASCLSDSYKPLFRFGGVRHDEHVREHAVYELHPPGSVPPPSAAGAPSSAPRAPPQALDPDVVARIEKRAVAILGPIAHLLAKSSCVRASTPRELALALAAYIPTTSERDEFLRACAAGSPSGSAPSSTDRPGSRPPPSSFDPAALERASRALAEHLGPVARVIVSRAAARARSEEELHDLLAAQIASPAERDAFRARLRRPR